MKKIALVIIFFIPFVASAALKADSAFRLDSIPALGIVFDKGWKFHAGDDKNWSDPAFNDSSWQNIDPTLLIGRVPQVSNAQIGWFRLKLEVSRPLQGQMIAFQVYQIGASEIYLNGKLICKYGKVSSNYDQEETFNPDGRPLTIQLGNEPEQVIAVRYSFNRQNWYKGHGLEVFYLAAKRPEFAWSDFDDTTNYFTQRCLVLGVFAILCLLHFSIYLTYRQRKISLYLSLLNLGGVCTFANGLMWHFLPHANFRFAEGTLFMVAAPCSFIFFLLMVHDLFDHPKKLPFKLLVALSILIIPLEFLPDYGYTEVYLGSCGILVYIEITRISIIAFKRKKPGSKLFLWGQSIAFLSFFSFNVIDIFGLNLSYNLQLIIVDITFLTPSVVFSILLGREFSKTNISLGQQLRQVEELSEKTIAQEIEKQNLLASQNEMLEQQVSERTSELSQSVINLKQTQTQLIQSEKMASLGELTAGIAHEIQNPLNFVNNFSDVSTELMGEMTEELEKGDLEEVRAIASDVTQNLEKIRHHGKRADAIVKGMLEHSRSSTGKKELTNLNALADEYLRLAYHGLRAKDKQFNAELVTRFDNKLPNLDVIPQDMGRVLLNLFNNAFYAVNQKAKTAVADYKPTIEVSTAKENGSILIKVKDNGNGIPEAIKDKIMQPFFTTKPTGEGTGLGLSLSYDIVVKGHGGSINVNTKEGEFTEFVVKLPL